MGQLIPMSDEKLTVNPSKRRVIFHGHVIRGMTEYIVTSYNGSFLGEIKKPEHRTDFCLVTNTNIVAWDIETLIEITIFLQALNGTQ